MQENTIAFNEPILILPQSPSFHILVCCISTHSHTLHIGNHSTELSRSSLNAVLQPVNSWNNPNKWPLIVLRNKPPVTAEMLVTVFYNTAEVKAHPESAGVWKKEKRKKISTCYCESTLEKIQICPSFLHFVKARVVFHIIYWNHCTSHQDAVNSTSRPAQGRYLSHNRHHCNDDSWTQYFHL